ncbi:MAG TPA: hypothetical protein VGN17_16585 [Bryobacteraceae bacterium]|jgi:hypothetical protein
MAQPTGYYMVASGTLSNGLVVKISTGAEPPIVSSRPVKIGLGGIGTSPDRIHRFVVDDASKSYFGYDLVAAPLGTKSYLVTFLPLQPTKQLEGMSPGPVPQFPAPQLVEEGDTIALDLLVSADGRQKIVDHIQVAPRRSPSAPTFTMPAVDNYTIDDGPLKFTVPGEHDVLINGQLQGGIGLTGKAGSTMWFYFPGQGRYIVSLLPPSGYGFQDAGTLRDNVIQFRADSNRYEIRFPEPLLAKGAYRLYVLRDPAFRPGNGADQILGGIDRLENLIKH